MTNVTLTFQAGFNTLMLYLAHVLNLLPKIMLMRC
jgi:hypothetical protein